MPSCLLEMGEIVKVMSCLVFYLKLDHIRSQEQLTRFDFNIFELGFLKVSEYSCYSCWLLFQLFCPHLAKALTVFVQYIKMSDWWVGLTFINGHNNFYH